MKNNNSKAPVLNIDPEKVHLLTAGMVAGHFAKKDADAGVTVQPGRTSTWLNQSELERPLKRYLADRLPQVEREFQAATNEQERGRLRKQLDVFRSHGRFDTPIGVKEILMAAVADVIHGRYTHPSGQKLKTMVLSWRTEYIGNPEQGVPGAYPTLPGKSPTVWHQGAKLLLKAMLARYEKEHGVKVPAPSVYSSRNMLQNSVFAAGIGDVPTGVPIPEALRTSNDPLAFLDEVDPLLHAQAEEAQKYDYRTEASRTATRREEQAESPYAQDYELGEEWTTQTEKALKTVGFGEGIIDPYSSEQMARQAEDLEDAIPTLESEIEKLNAATSARIDEIFKLRNDALAATDRIKKNELWEAYNAAKGELDDLFADRKANSEKLSEFKRTVKNIGEKASGADEIQHDRFILTVDGEDIGPVAHVMTDDRIKDDEDHYVVFSTGRKEIYPAHINRRANAIRRERQAQNEQARQAYQEAVNTATRNAKAALIAEGMNEGTAGRLAAREANRLVPHPKLLETRLITCVIIAMAEERRTNGWTNTDQRAAHAQLARAAKRKA